MTWIQIAATLALVFALAWPLGAYIAHVLRGERTVLTPLTGGLERLLLKALGVRADAETGWREYARALFVFNALGFVALYALLRLQHVLPLNPLGLGPVSPHLAFDTALSFVTNTNWQSYGGETTVSFLAQMSGLTVQNFVSAATGLAVLAALVRGFTRGSASTLGSFWVDLVRATVHVLLPLSVVLALVLSARGVVQTFDASAEVQLLAPVVLADGSTHATQTIALGPAASQVAIKQLGTNGGGFFNANSAHPLENPDPFTNLLELVAILLVPAALCRTFGILVGDPRQGRALLAVMLVLLVPAICVVQANEQAGTPALRAAGAELAASDTSPGGNLEGKEVRFGVAQSSLWAAATTAASNGSVNAMHDSFTPLGGLAPLALMLSGEVSFGGVGSGLYGLLVFAIVAVFVAGLMVGRTPEYLGKKIGAFEMQMASVAILAPCCAVLAGAAVCCALADGRASAANPGAHGFSEIFYAFASASNNNGSAFAGLNANVPLYDTLLGVAMFVGRYLVIVPVLALAGSLAAKRTVPASAGTLPTHGPLFVVLVTGTILLVGALTFFPALALGPIVEHVQMGR